MHHVLGYSSSLAASTEALIDPITDDVLQSQNSGFFFNDPLECFGGALMSADVQYGKIVTPSLNCYGYSYIDTISQAAGGNYNGKLTSFRTDNPIMLKGRELLQLQGFQSNAGAQTVNAALFVWQGRSPVPVGEQFTIRATSTTAAVAAAWTTVDLTWPVNLPVGNYAVIGGKCISVDGIAWRLNAQDCKFRPGGFTVNDANDNVNPVFRHGGLGSWCTFDNNLMPELQVFSSTTTAAHTLYLDVVKL